MLLSLVVERIIVRCLLPIDHLMLMLHKTLNMESMLFRYFKKIINRC